MKRNILTVLILVFIFGLCACADSNSSNSNNKKATIVTLQGNTVQKSVDDLNNEKKENVEKFKQTYPGANISITGTFKSLTTIHFDSYYVIILEEGWGIEIKKDQDCGINLSDLSAGMKLKIDSQISWDNLSSVWGIKSNSTKISIIK